MRPDGNGARALSSKIIINRIVFYRSVPDGLNVILAVITMRVTQSAHDFTGKLPILEVDKDDKWLINICREMRGFSEAACDVLSNLLAEDTERPSAAALLQHPWFETR